MNKFILRLFLKLQPGYFIFFTFGCEHPTELGEWTSHHRSPEEAVTALKRSYAERNLDLYMSSLSEESRFGDATEYLWGIEQEKTIHQKMFASAKEIDLDINELLVDESAYTYKSTIYNYRLNVQLRNEQVLEAQGQASLEFVQNKLGFWQINSFREINTARNIPSNKTVRTSTANDSIDYFPLTVGNYWNYYDRINPTLPDVQAIVTDSLIIRGNLYYSFQQFGFPFFIQPAFVRVNSIQQLIIFIPPDSSELTIFDLGATIGDSLFLQFPGAHDVMIVELQSKRDSLKVPAGTFANVLEFLITDFGSGSRYIYEFAANVGIIRQRGTNQELVLKNAQVNGKKYPLITGVETRFLSWSQIKLRFR
jgi:hypothetical protein